MRREDKRNLMTNRRIIVKYLQELESILDYLITKHIFTPEIRKKIISNNDLKDRIRQTLDCLVQKNALSYQYFLESLIITNNEHNKYLVDTLQPDYRSSKECQLMIEREHLLLQYPLQISIEQQKQSESRLYQTDFTSNLSFPLLNQEHNLTPISTKMRPSNLALPNHLQQSVIRPERYSMNSNFSSQSSRSSSQSQSMSPTTSRARSSSVINIYNLPNTRQRSSNNCITSRSNSGGFNISEHENHISTPVSVSNDQNDRWTSPTNQNNRPYVYDLRWEDVNNLELDFPVYTTIPNTRPIPDCYTMEKKPRGLCLIINNENFYDENGVEIATHKRYGTNMDASRLKNLFEKLHFVVEMCVDMSEKDMRIKISQFAKEAQFNSHMYDAVTLIILTHGTDGYVYGVDAVNRINLDKDILPLFDDVMIGKPKLFIFQACRGDNINQKEKKLSKHASNSQPNTPVITVPTTSKISILTKTSEEEIEENLTNKLSNLRVSSTQTQTTQTKYKKNSTASSNKSKKKNQSRSRSHSRGKYTAYLASAATAIKSACKLSPSSVKNTQTISTINEEKISTQISNFIDGIPIKTHIPARSDFFIWYSSARGFVSHRDLDGSPFIKCLVTVFSRCAYELELCEMIRKVNNLMQQYESIAYNETNAEAKFFMAPVSEYHLAKGLYFNP